MSRLLPYVLIIALLLMLGAVTVRVWLVGDQERTSAPEYTQPTTKLMEQDGQLVEVRKTFYGDLCVTDVITLRTDGSVIWSVPHPEPERGLVVCEDDISVSSTPEKP